MSESGDEKQQGRRRGKFVFFLSNSILNQLSKFLLKK